VRRGASVGAVHSAEDAVVVAAAAAPIDILIHSMINGIVADLRGAFAEGSGDDRPTPCH
jgi:hypothetical protein